MKMGEVAVPLVVTPVREALSLVKVTGPVESKVAPAGMVAVRTGA